MRPGRRRWAEASASGLHLIGTRAAIASRHVQLQQRHKNTLVKKKKSDLAKKKREGESEDGGEGNGSQMSGWWKRNAESKSQVDFSLSERKGNRRGKEQTTRKGKLTPGARTHVKHRPQRENKATMGAEEGTYVKKIVQQSLASDARHSGWVNAEINALDKWKIGGQRKERTTNKSEFRCNLGTWQS